MPEVMEFFTEFDEFTPYGCIYAKKVKLVNNTKIG